MSNAVVVIDGIEHKIGRFGFVYRWSESLNEWIKSTKTVGEFNDQLKKRAG